MKPSLFQHKLLIWFDAHGRKNLPWQHPISPYRVWLSEIMLQQTQVATVLPYFKSFIEKFPDIDGLAHAHLDEILALWSGLGYYARARNLHKTAQLISIKGYFPDCLEELLLLPGIGRSTAGAILSIAFNKSTPILDGNVRRVLTRFLAIHGWPGTNSIENKLWGISTELTPLERVADYTQAIMDLGATVCTRANPGCGICPLNNECQAYLTQTVSEFPSPKITKALPVKECTMLMLINQDNEIILEKRPPSGIWGGLWSLPEFDSPEIALTWCDQQNMRINRKQLSNKHRHTFSHYHLDFTVLILETDTLAQVNEANRLISWDLRQVNALGLPAPIKKFLKTIQKEPNNG